MNYERVTNDVFWSLMEGLSTVHFFQLLNGDDGQTSYV